MRPDITNEIPEAILTKGSIFQNVLSNVFQVHHPKYFIFWDRRINVFSSKNPQNSDTIPSNWYGGRKHFAEKNVLTKIIAKNNITNHEIQVVIIQLKF